MNAPLSNLPASKGGIEVDSAAVQADTLASTSVLVVRSSITGGHRHHEDEIVRNLPELGCSVRAVQVRYPHQSLFGRSTPTDDLYHAVQAARVVRRVDPGEGVLVFTTVTDALLQRTSVLRRAVVRFDALSRENRTGWRGAIQRRLERRVLARAAVLAPRSVRSLPERSDLALHALPSAVLPIARASGEPIAPYMFFYGGENVRKKGLDVAVRAWSTAALPGLELRVAGTEAEAGRRFLLENGVEAPASVRWLGKIPNVEFRQQAAAATAYISASRYEEFGVAQIEALADGVPVVTVSTDGPVEIVPIMRSIAPDLVADGIQARTLADALHAVADWDSKRRAEYRGDAAEAARAYSQDAVRNYLRTAVLAARGNQRTPVRP